MNVTWAEDFELHTLPEYISSKSFGCVAELPRSSACSSSSTTTTTTTTLLVLLWTPCSVIILATSSYHLGPGKTTTLHVHELVQQDTGLPLTYDPEILKEYFDRLPGVQLQRMLQIVSTLARHRGGFRAKVRGLEGPQLRVFLSKFRVRYESLGCRVCFAVLRLRLQGAWV